MKEIVQTGVFRRWEKGLKDTRVKTLIAARLFRLANGLSGDVKPVGEGVSEFRIHYGPGYRIYFKQQGNMLIILLCGGDKRTQSKDILLARALVHSLDIEKVFGYE
ncbi:type II toxin-antitoxin system RelE/ParE family toxin [Trabulsiella odontotermitis]|uniref:type II toxin-antitoxin system RelE/ParE family toxin n=1 Tax=Trabulsiella odontotermitis TaxID=379893 RepID=UPI0006BA287F|nr:type II toxin-antitoxin system RelE/ParE family toxin [Trabulsiella odontotermitis]